MYDEDKKRTVKATELKQLRELIGENKKSYKF